MDLIMLYDKETTGDGLDLMLTHYLGSHDYVRRWVSMEVACMISALAKRVGDTGEFFPNGKWAVIQALDERIHKEIGRTILSKTTKEG